MVSRKHFSAKQLAIDKANGVLVLAVGVTAFVVVFSMVSCKALLSQSAYQTKVLGERKKALKTLKENITAAEQLEVPYKEFASQPQNVLGGNARGTGPNDGGNSRIVLDALPSKYDFPALTNSLEKLLTDKGFQPTKITGTDEEVQQSANTSSSAPEPVVIPFVVEAPVAPDAAKGLVQLFERSIRPLQVQKLTLSGADGQLKVIINGQTFFQPEKNLNIKVQVVK